jgi:hypothetical protein
MSTGFQEYAFYPVARKTGKESRRVRDFPDTNRKKTMFKFSAVAYQLADFRSAFVTSKHFSLSILYKFYKEFTFGIKFITWI